MARLGRDALLESATRSLEAVPDPDGVADLVASRGRIVVAASGDDVGPAVRRLRDVPGYRWLVINAADLFAASPLTIGTKIGLLDPGGRVLKAADLPRPK